MNDMAAKSATYNKISRLDEHIDLIEQNPLELSFFFWFLSVKMLVYCHIVARSLEAFW